MNFFEKVKANNIVVRTCTALVAMVVCAVLFCTPLFKVSKIGDNVSFGDYVSSKGVVDVDSDYVVEVSPINGLNCLINIVDIFRVNGGLFGDEDLEKMYKAAQKIDEDASAKSGYLLFEAFSYISDINSYSEDYDVGDFIDDVLGMLSGDDEPGIIGVLEGITLLVIAVMSLIVAVMYVIKSIIYVIKFFTKKLDDEGFKKLESNVIKVFMCAFFYVVIGLLINGLNISFATWFAFALSLIALVIRGLILRLNDYTEKQKKFINITQLSGAVELVLIFLFFVILGASGALSTMMPHVKLVFNSLTDDNETHAVIAMVSIFLFCIFVFVAPLLISTSIDKMLLSGKEIKARNGSVTLLKNNDIKNGVFLVLTAILPIVYSVAANKLFGDISLAYMDTTYYVAIAVSVLVIVLNVVIGVLNKKFIPDLTKEEMDAYMKGNF